ncbi:MAG: hypothetical protein OXJ52_05510 [Oligoflexia bacterium]|nr:hypothetical protein [Oligoflexia bacterium]
MFLLFGATGILTQKQAVPEGFGTIISKANMKNAVYGGNISNSSREAPVNKVKRSSNKVSSM